MGQGMPNGSSETSARTAEADVSRFVRGSRRPTIDAPPHRNTRGYVEGKEGVLEAEVE